VRRLLFVAICFAGLVPGPTLPAGAGVVLHAGDLVMVDTGAYPYLPPGLWRLDPTTLDTTLIASGGLLVQPRHIAVDRAGIIYVTDSRTGVVSIDPATGGQSLFLSPSALGGGNAAGICLADDSTLIVTATGSNTGVVLSVILRTHEVSVLSQGGLLENPECVAVGPGGTLYVGDASANSAPNGSGSIVRVEVSGAQSLFANGELFHDPFDIAVSSDGWVWTAQWGWTSRRGGGFLRTRLTDGLTEVIESDRSQGVVATQDGVFLGDCISISLDCYSAYRFVHRYDGGAQRYLPAGAMAVVPAMTTPTRRTSWGALKTHYR
jgi:sugar lactone lactonase YvrE